MKAIRLLIAAMLITATTAASARDYVARGHRQSKKSRPEVLFIASNDDDEPEIYEFETPEEVKYHVKERARCLANNKELAAAQLTEKHPTGFQSAQAPSLIFAQRDNKFAFGIGGYINLRSSYDFNGTVSDIDFVTADIPIPGTYATRQQFMMDASTSRIFLSGIINSRALGSVHIYVDMDFRGGVDYSDGITNNYTPRIRSAYASFLGFTIGRDVTTFCDLHSAPQTIDFQGPNAYSFNFATVLRYQHSFCRDRLTTAIALEQPNVSATYDTTFEAIPQRMPDVPMYIQYSMGREMQHHLRVSAVLRDMYAYNSSTEENTSLLGWGVQFSGRLEPAKWMGICFSGIYGEGITQYIQDLNGLGLDFTPNPANSNSIQTMPMYAWQAAMNLNFTEKLTATGGYSIVRIQKENGYYSNTEYRQGQYIFGNLFYAVTPRLQVACEYLYGKRCQMNCVSNTANRASIMAQYSF